MRKSFPRLYVRNYRLIVICIILTGLVGFGVSASSNSGSETSRRDRLAGGAAQQKANPASIIASVFNFPMPLPSLTVTVTDTIPGDAGEIGKAGVGETIRYTVKIDNAGPDAATNLKLEDTIDANTTLVGGSIVISPLAADETYQSVGNMTLTSSAIAADCATNSLRSVTCNDTLRGASLTGFGDSLANANAISPGNPLAIAGKGTVTLQSDGTFVFNPVAAFEGDFEFWYTLTNNTVTPALTDTAKVTITVGGANGLVWFVGPGGTGSGTQDSPYSLAGFNIANNGLGTNPADNDAVFLFEGAHTGPVTLRNGQKFLGQDSTVSANTVGAPAPQPGNSYPSNTGTAVTITAASNAITLGSGNTLAGLTVGDVGSANAAITGTAVGTFRVRDVVINTNGRALDITTSGDAFSDATYTGFTSVTSTGGANNISLILLTGTLNLGSGALSGASGIAFAVGGAAANSGGTVSINYSGTISNTTSRAVSIRNKNGGTVSFSGAISSTTSGGNGIFLDANTGATFNFTGGITANVTSGEGFRAQGGGTINITGTNNIDTTSGQGLQLNGVTVGSSGITFNTVDKNANTGSNEAVDIDSLGTTGGGSVSIASSTVVGNPVGSGLAGIDINASNAAITITSVTIDNTDGPGINLVNNTANIFVNGGTIGTTNDPTGNAVDIDQGSANVTIAAAITKSTANRIVDITNRTGGSIGISNTLSCTGSCSGINVQNITSGVNTVTFSGGTKTLNTGGNTAVTLDNVDNATVTFSGGGLDIDTTTGIGFNAINGASSINVTTGANPNTINSTGNTALVVNGGTIGVSDLTFQSIASGGGTNGINLTNTGSSGGLIVTGSGGTCTDADKSGCSGGTLQNHSDDGIIANNTQDLSLTRMFINNPGVHGIDADNLRGTNTVANTVINNWTHATGIGLRVVNLNANLTKLTVSATTFNGSATGNDGLFMEAQGSSDMKLVVESGCLFTDIFGDGLEIQGVTGSTGTINATIKNSSFTNAPALGNGGIQLDPFGGVNLLANIEGNTMNSIMNNVTNLGAIGGTNGLTADADITIKDNNLDNIIGARGITFAATGTGANRLLIDNNSIDSLGSTTKYAIQVNMIGTLGVNASNGDVTVTNNDIGQAGPLWTSGNGTAEAVFFVTQNTSTLKTLVSNNIVTANATLEVIRARADDTSSQNITYTNNTVTDSVPSHVGELAVRTQDSGAICMSATGNNLAGGATGVILVSEGGTGTVNVTQSQAVLSTGNNNATVTVVGTPQFSQPACTTPASPTLPTTFYKSNDARREYLAQVDNLNNTGSFFASLNDSTSFASVTEFMTRLAAETSPSTASYVEPQKNDAATVNEVSSNLTSAEPSSATASVRPEIEKGAYALAHGDNSGQSLGSRLSSFISTVASAVAPTAHAAPAPMPALEVNESLGTLPANKSVTVVFDVTVNGPHPFEDYTNTATVKADGIADIVEQTVTPGDRYNTTTTLTADPPSPAFTSDNVTFTATVTPSEQVGVVNPATGGSVQFKDGATNLGSPVPCTADGNNCKAELETNSLAPGTWTAGSHSITAEYLGGTHHEPSTSSPALAYTVNACTVDPIVTNGSDGTGPVPAGSLRDAIINACPGSNITFDTTSGGFFDPAGGADTIQLVAALPDIDKNLTITGPGADMLDVRGKIATLADPTGFRVFNITSGTVNIISLTISNGGSEAPALALNGGGVSNAGNLTLTEVTVKENNATLLGGGIYNTGTLLVDKSTVSNNTAVQNGGGIYNSGTLTVRNSTIAFNTSNTLGGGIYNNSANTTTVESSTIAQNTAATGGGINNAAGTFNITNTIVGDNTGTTASPDLFGTFNSTGYNLFEDTTGALYTPTTGDQTGDPKLQTLLTDNGGPTLTLAPAGDSPAIDKGNTTLTDDQRGEPREVDNPNIANAAGGDASDIGAIELPAPPSAPDLDAASDLGTLDTDNITSDNTPTFTIGGVQNGEEVYLLRDGVVVTNGTATGTSIQLTEPAAVADGSYSYTARRAVNGGLSPQSAALSPVVIDAVAPTINISAPSLASANASTTSVTYTITYGGADAISLATGDVSLVVGGTAGASIGVSGSGNTERTVTLSSFTGEGTLGITIASGTASDTAGNAAPAAGPSTTFAVDTVVPTVSTSVRADANPTGAASVNFTVTFSENVTGVDTGDFELTLSGVSGATVASVTPVTASQYTVTVNTGTGDGTLRLDVDDDDSILDGALNPLGGTGANNGDFTGGQSYIIDKTDPVVSSIVRASVNPTNAASVNYTVTFSEDVSNVDTGDFALATTGGIAGASVATVTPINATQYTVAVNTGTGDGTIGLNLVDDNSIVDQASKPLGGPAAGDGNFTGQLYAVDKSAPTALITAVTPDPRNTSVSSIQIVFSEAISGFDLADLSLTRNGGANLLTGAQTLSTSDNITWTLGNLSGLTGAEGTYLLTLTASGSNIKDAATNDLTTDATETWVVDTTAPGVSMTTALPDPTNTKPIPVTVTFTEPVIGFTASDVVATNALVQAFTGSGAIYSFKLTPTAQATITANIAANIATDAAGNNNTAATEFSITYDSVRPTVKINKAVPDPRNSTVSSLEIVFSEAITGFDLADLSLTLDGGANLLTGAQTLTSGDNITWTLNNLTGLTGSDGFYQLTLADTGTVIKDAANNSLTAGAVESWTVNTTKPSVTINQAASQADPVTNTPSINFTVVFSKPVTGFDSTDVTFSGANATTATVHEITPYNDMTYMVLISGMTTPGVVTASINADAAQDSIGNLSTASTSIDNSVTWQQNIETTFEVNSTDNTDDGACAAVGTGNGCTLREAINAANLDAGAETITFAAALTSGGPATITLTDAPTGLGALPQITGSVTIIGPTNENLTISGNDTHRIFDIDASHVVNISNLTIADGRASFGGGIYNLGALTIRNSTFTGNHATFDGGAIDSDSGSLTITNSTFSGNSADGGGGAIHHCGDSTGFLTNVTITNNRSDADDAGPPFEGGGLEQVSSNNITLNNTIVAGNFMGTASPTDNDIFVASGFSTLDGKNNLVGVDTGLDGISNGTDGNQVGTAASPINALLGALADNGGPTFTHLLLTNSPAINTGSNTLANAASLTTDQRGTGFPRIIKTTVDIGAVEVNYVMTATSGTTPQSTPINTDFATDLQVTVTESGNPQNNLPVTFTAPGAGASGTFAASSTVMTDTNGVATAPVFTANGIAGGPYNVTASLPGGLSASFVLTNTKAQAQVNLSNLTHTYDGAQKSATVATVPAGLNVVVTYDGVVLSPINVGSYAVVATVNDANYSGTDSDTLTINKAGSTTTVTVNNAIFDGNPHGGTAVATGAGGLNQSLTVTYTGRNATTYGPSTTPPTNTGDYTASATFAGDANHNGSSDSENFSITKANQTITFNPLATKTFGNPDFTVSAASSSGLPVSFGVTGQCSLVGSNTIHITAAGSCTVTASQAGNSNFNAAANVNQIFTINKAAQTVTFNALPNKKFGDADFNVSATASSGLAVVFTASGNCTVTGNTVHLTGAGSCQVAAGQAGNSNYYAANGVLRSFQIAKATTTTTVSSSANPSGAGDNVTFTATVSSGAGTPTGTVQFKVDGTNTGGPVTLNGSGAASLQTSSLTVGLHSITVAYNGSANFATSNGALAGGQRVTNQQNALTSADSPAVGFSSSSYQISEGATNTPEGFASLSVDVVRTGDTSAPATVEYVTSDLSGGNECDVFNGQANQRCDYTLVGTTLRFAAGETTKTISIPVINDGYVEGPEFFSIQLQNPVGMSLGSPAQATLTITDDDVTATTGANNPYLSTSFFVRQNYLDFLGRDADRIGFTEWKNVLDNCGPQKGYLGAQRSCDMTHVSHGFYGSQEFTNTGFLVYRLYEVGMNRLPRYTEFVPDMATLSGFGISASVEQQNLADYLKEFTAKPEFTNRFQDVLQPSQAAALIQKLEQTAGVTLPASATTLPGQPAQYGRAELIEKRASGEFTVGQTLKAFVEQKAVYDEFFPRGQVTMLYFAYLKRDPSLNDPELVGWSDWVHVFTNGKPSEGIAPRDINHLIFGFVYSEEYRKRFGAP